MWRELQHLVFLLLLVPIEDIIVIVIGKWLIPLSASLTPIYQHFLPLPTLGEAMMIRSMPLPWIALGMSMWRGGQGHLTFPPHKAPMIRASMLMVVIVMPFSASLALTCQHFLPLLVWGEAIMIEPLPLP